MEFPLDRAIRVLCVDDDAAILDLTSTFLERAMESATVATEQNPERALERFREEHFDCLVCDYEMPEMNGLELLEEVRAIDDEVPFLLFTGTGSERIATKAMSHGATGYLQKEGGVEQFTLLNAQIARAVDQYRTTQQLARQIGFFQAVFDDPRSSVGLLTPDGVVVDANQRLLTALDVDLDAVIGMPYWVIADGVDADRLREAIGRAATGEYVEFAAGEGPNDRSLDAAQSDAHVQAPSDLLSGVIRPVAIEDEVRFLVVEGRGDSIEHDQRNEIGLKNAAMDEAPVGITITDPSRPDNPIIYANEQFHTMTGYPIEDILGRNCRFLQGEETEAEPVTKMREAIEAEESVLVELRNYRRDGTLFWNEVTIAPIRDDDGECTHFVGFQQDVTRRKLAEERLTQQNERLDEFTSVVSHDLRGPLTAATGYLELVREHCADENPFLDDVATAHDRMASMIHDMLVLAQAGAIVDELEPTSIATVVESAWNTLSHPGSSLQVRIDETARTRADENRLTQLFENHLRNSLDHGTGEDDAVTITVGALEDGFFLEDDGPGIPSEDCEEVFTSGFTTTPGGTGFGLRIVKDIVEAHGWEIEAISREETGDGVGARFEVTGVEFL